MKNKGISLIVLVITIIVMIVLAGTIIVSITNADVFTKAADAQRSTDMDSLNSALSVVYSEYLVDKNLGQDPVDEGQTIAVYLREQLIAKGVVIPENVVINDNGIAVDFETAVASVAGDVAFDKDGNQVSLSNWRMATWEEAIGGFASGRYLGNITNGQIEGGVPFYIKKGDKEGYVKSLAEAFCDKTALTIVPQLNTSGVIYMFHMFSGCRNLTTIPQLDTSSVTDMEGMFYNCNNLTTIPQLDTSSATNMQDMFYNCSNLTTLPNIFVVPASVTKITYMFDGCRKLTGSVQFQGNISSDANYTGAFTNAGIDGTGFTVNYTSAFTNIETVKSASTGTSKITWTLLP